MILKQFQKVDGLKAVVKLPVPMAAVQIEERFSIVNDEDGSIIHGEAYDYLMEGLKGELYVCRRDVFEACYKYVESAQIVEGVAQYRKKPVVIDAIQWDGKNTFDIVTFIDGDKPDLSTLYAGDKWYQYVTVALEKGLTIKTLEDGPDGRAAHVASVGDFIIKGVAGEFYACKPEIFAATYEVVS